MKEYIYQRKSVRNYKLEKLSEGQLNQVREQIAKLQALFADIKYEIIISDKVNGLFKVNAPHYLLFYSEVKAGYLQNIGFIGQYLSLYLSSINLGSCWLGVAKATEKRSLPFVISMAFGVASEALFREEKQFIRKDISEVSNVNNKIVNAGRLAPSAVNVQDWYFFQQGKQIHCYQKKLDFLKAKMLGDKMPAINLGIALCHLSIMLENYEIIKIEDPPFVEAGSYFITIVAKE